MWSANVSVLVIYWQHVLFMMVSWSWNLSYNLNSWNGNETSAVTSSCWFKSGPVTIRTLITQIFQFKRCIHWHNWSSRDSYVMSRRKVPRNFAVSCNLLRSLHVDESSSSEVLVLAKVTGDTTIRGMDTNKSLSLLTAAVICFRALRVARNELMYTARWQFINHIHARADGYLQRPMQK
jgi:hypothetical protein